MTERQAMQLTQRSGRSPMLVQTDWGKPRNMSQLTVA